MRLHPVVGTVARASTARDRAIDHGLLIFRSLLEILVVAIFVFTFVAQPAHVPSASMWPTIHAGDMMLADNQSFAPEGHFAWMLPSSAVRRGELAIFRFPPHPRTMLVKRIVAVAGDRIRLREGHVFVNGTALVEPYAVYTDLSPDLFRDDFPTLRSLDPGVDPGWWAQLRRSIDGDAVRVPTGEVFVLGDNRDDSEDSRYWGFVPVNELVGQPLLVYLPAPDPLRPQASVSRRIGAFLHGIRVLR